MQKHLMVLLLVLGNIVNINTILPIIAGYVNQGLENIY